MWVGTDGRGVFHFRSGKPIEHFTFESTGGALRSDHIFGVFVDPEKVVWFATDKGVCRYDSQAMRAENIATDPNANYVRALFRTSHGRLFAGTNSGLYTNDGEKKGWTEIPELGRRIILCGRRRQSRPSTRSYCQWPVRLVIIGMICSSHVCRCQVPSHKATVFVP